MAATTWAAPGPSIRKPADLYPSDVAWRWFELLYDVVKTEKTTPPPASRIYGLSAVAVYEAIVPGTLSNRSLVGQLNDLSAVPQPLPDKGYHWPLVANRALAHVIRGLFPATTPPSLEAINALEESINDEFEPIVPGPVFARSVEHGQAVADAILAWSAGDGYEELNNCPYVPVPVPGAWEPTPPGFVPNPLQPCWGQIRTMALISGAECPAPQHPAFSTDVSSDFYAAGAAVYTVGLGLTAEQKTIADYWSDNAGVTGTPPGHWVAIASQIARNDGLSLAAAAEAYARVGIAVHDAFIACWRTKYDTNLQRPVTYIIDNIDASWLSYIVTPAFPTYTSGHSTQSGAATRVLTGMFGIKAFTDTMHTDHDLDPPQEPRSFDSFDEAGAEAAVSRLYGGIHYTFDNNEGLRAGQCIGQVILDRVSFREE
jgi:hypothetical protein